MNTFNTALFFAQVRKTRTEILDLLSTQDPDDRHYAERLNRQLPSAFKVPEITRVTAHKPYTFRLY